MSEPPLFSLSHVSKRFGYRTVLRDISCTLLPGDFVLLLGGNGAGKSTLLKILSSLMRPSAGELRFGGETFASAGSALRSALGMISHESRFYGDLTARENLRLFGTLYGVEGLGAKIDQVLEEVRLAAFPDIPVRAFSSGMQKRLAIARLLLYRPRVLLLDEPYSGLDMASVDLLDEFLRRFKSQGGTTVLVTHQFTSGVAYCNRILILHQGTLVYNESQAEVTVERCSALLNRFTQARPAG